ncbi:MAG TPA: glycosyltransferase family 4 protein [Blastocatellia bacterium]|nr:glycosyltransferase family 4 protein [Blastocatellia bacterium]
MAPYVIVTGDFVRTGGMDMANLALASYLAERGVELHLVAHRVDTGLCAYPNVRVHSVSKPLDSYLLGSPLLDRVGRAWASKITARSGRVVVNGGNCSWSDINWIHYVHAAYTPQASGRAIYRLKTDIAHRKALTSERATLAGARLVLCNSHRTRRDIIEHLGVAEDRVNVVYYGSDPKRFSPITPEQRSEARRSLGLRDERPLIAFVGALGDRRKGFDTLFKAWQTLCADKDWDCDLVVIGAGAELNDWKRQAGERNLTGRIKFLGFRQDVHEVLAACDALAHPARYEAYGLVVREALCRNVPAIVSAASGVAEHYDGRLRQLLIQDPNKPDEVRERLWNWRRNINTIKEEVAPLSNSLRSHTWEGMAAQMIQLIEARN